jgi:hypothetical protein
VRAGTAGALVLLALLVTLPAAALGAKPAPPWPSAKDIAKGGLGMQPRDAACIARYDRGRLSLAAWLKPYWDDTAAEKRATDAGLARCMTHAERLAWEQRFFTRIAGKLPEVHCVAVRSDGQSEARRLTQTSHARWARDYEAIFRSCGLTGAVYAEVAVAKLHLPFTRAARRCANRVGSGEAIMYKPVTTVRAQRNAIGAVYDTCAGAASEQAMYRYLYRKYPFPSKVPCIARRLAAAVGFGAFINNDPSVLTDERRAEVACLSTG